MKLIINSEVITSLKPCKDRYENWITHYKDFDGNILDFLELENITAQDKIWVSIRILPKELVEAFAIDCALSATAYAACATNAAAIDAAYSAAANSAAIDAAYYAAANAAAIDAAYYATYYAIAATNAANAATNAANAAYVANAAYAANAATNAVNAAYAADAAAYTERENQVDALIMLIESWK